MCLHYTSHTELHKLS